MLLLNHPRKRYFVLAASRVSCFKENPADRNEAPVKSGIIDPYMRVTDHGRESIHGIVLFMFTIYDSYNHEDKLKFGARSSEEAAQWMLAFKEAAEQAQPTGKDMPFVPAGGRRRLYPFRLSGRRGSGLVRDSNSGRDNLYKDDSSNLAEPISERGQYPQGEEALIYANFVPDWTGSLISKDASPDVIAASPWQIFGCKNGLRLFRETTDHQGLKSKIRGEDPPALMAVGVVHATCEAIFETVMALGPSRAEWDFCFLRGRVIEHIDGHADIVHKQFHNYWLPWRMKPRDLLVHRYWRREDDGSYVILYRSVTHEKCPTRQKFVRAWLKSGGYVISPLQPHGGYSQRCLVKHMLTVDWRHWNTCWNPSRDKDITLRVLERVAAIREVYKVKLADCKPITTGLSACTARALDGRSPQEAKEEGQSMTGFQQDGDPTIGSLSDGCSTILQLADDEFYDVPEESSWEQGVEPELGPHDSRRQHSEMEGTSYEDETGGASKLSAAATIVKRLHVLASSAQKRTQPGMVQDDIDFFIREGSLPKCGGISAISCWNIADASTFLIRGKNYLRDHKKVVAQDPVMQFVAADWFKSNKREDNLASRPTNLVQVALANQKQMAGRVEDSFFFIVNFQVPGATSYSLVLYYITTKPISELPLLARFVHGDDRFRNSRFKLIPHIAKGSWIVKQSVGKTACLVGQALEITYHKGSNYLELDVDIGSSSVAKGVVNLVVGYLSKLVIEMAFLIQASTEEELPEYLLGTCRLSHLDISKAVQAPPE